MAQHVCQAMTALVQGQQTVCFLRGRPHEQVFTLDGHVISTPFVIRDPAMLPFGHGLCRQLAQISTSALVALPSEVDLSLYVLDNGVDMLSLHRV